MQQSLFTQSEQTSEEYVYLEEERKKLRKPKEGQRVHYKIPKYKKVYSVYQYDWELYTSKFDMLTAIIAGMARHSPKQAERLWSLINPYQVLENCYIFDECGKLQYLGDEKHIYRLPTLIKIHRLIYNYCEKDACHKGTIIKHGFILHHEYQEAELENTWQLPIKQRLKLHIQILRKIETFGGMLNIIKIVMFIAIRIYLKKYYFKNYKYLRHLENSSKRTSQKAL